MTDQSADKQATEKLIEALMKIGATMADISKAQGLLKAIHAEQREQREAMVRLAALVEGHYGSTTRPH